MNKSVWRRAAELVDNDVYVGCCCAIEDQFECYDEAHDVIARFRDAIGARNNYESIWWWETTAQGKQSRIIALLLMELLERDGL